MKETLFKCLLKFARGKRSEIHFGGKGRVADLPLPKAVKSRSLEGIYPKWPNFPKIVLSRPVGGGTGGGKPKQNNKHTAHTDCASGLRSGFSLQSASHPCHGRTPGRTGGAPLRTPYTPASAGVVFSPSTCCSACHRHDTPAAQPPYIQPHPGQRVPLSLQRESRRQKRWRPGDLHRLPLSSLKLALFSRAQ